MKTYLFIYSGSLLLAMIFTPIVIFVAGALNIYDDIHARKIHASAVPRLGGVAIFLSMMLVTVPTLLLDNPIGESFRQIGIQPIVLLMAGGFMFAIGFIDDLCGVRARYKLIAQLIAAVAMCIIGVRIDSVSVEGLFSIQLGWLAWPITILWIAGVTNAVNFIDGLDGLAGGIAAIVCGVIAAFSIYTGQTVMAVLMLALLGSLTGFLLFNFNPAKVFMGDCGSLFLGFIIGSASVMCASKSATIVGLALPFLALGVPLFDMVFSMLRRILERRSMFSPDRGHVHHRLLDMGIHHRHVVLVLYAITALAAGLGMFMMVTRNAGTVLIFAMVSLLIMLFFRIVGAVRLRESINRLRDNIRTSCLKRDHIREFEDASLLFRNADTFEQWWQSICEAGHAMGLAYLAMTFKQQDGTISTEVWRNSDFNPDPDPDPNKPYDVIQMSIPIRDHRSGQPLRMDIGVIVDGSLEFSTHRAKLFTRLIDEHNIAERSKECRM